MNILILNWRDIEHPWAGGAEVNIHEQAKRWVQWGHSVTMLCGGFPPSRRGQRTPRETIIDGVRIIRRGGRYSVYVRAAMYYLRHLRGQMDVVLDAANGIPFFTPLYCRVPKVLMFNHVHLKQWFIELPWPLAVVGYALERWVVRLFYRGSQVVAISESTKDDLRRAGISPERVAVVRPGVDHARYSVKAQLPELQRLIYVGRLRRYKRLDTLIRLTKDLAVEMAELRLDIVGVGEDREFLEEVARQEGVDDRVVFHGYVSHEQKVSLLQQASLYVTPSMNEGWGIGVLEANACGVPAAAFDVPGLNESIRHQETGLLAKSYDDLRRQVADLLRDAERRQAMAGRAVRWAAEFDWQITSRQMLGVFSDLLVEQPSTGQPVPRATD